jgi:microcystin degradation protein MlrC
MRIAIGQLWQETNTFNPWPTTRRDFEQFGVLRGPALVEQMADTNELGGFIQFLRSVRFLALRLRANTPATLAVG